MLASLSGALVYSGIQWAFGGNFETSPHGSTTQGVNRLSGVEPQGSCGHCHYEHYSYDATTPPHVADETEAGGPFNYLLFKNTSSAGNAPCFKTTGCHKELPATYPATETDRMPTGSTYPGYYEKNSGADTKVWGVNNRARWTGQTNWENATYSLHYVDGNMPEQDGSGKGKCTNCHNPHGTASTYDTLTAKDNTGGTFESVTNPYTGVKDTALAGNRDSQGRPKSYALCFSCHSEDATARGAGMNASSKKIGFYYSQTTNNDNESGHQITKDADIATSWPAWVQVGDKLDCSSCHNPHGTGSNNKKLISDQVGINTVSNFDPGVAASVRGFCFSCHCASDAGVCTNTVQGITMKQIPAKTEHTAGNGTSCFNCHGNDFSTNTARNVHHPSRGESPGGVQCSDCHNAIYTAMQTNTTYHHVLEATTAAYPNVAAPAADANTRRCLMCHADHDIFRPDINSPGGARGSNLRTDIALNPDAVTDTNFTNTDFVNSGSGGICLSCHRTNSQTKDYSGANVQKNDTQTTTTITLPLWGGLGTVADYNASVHNYTVSSTFTSDSSTFNANCVKCHNDDSTKEKQNSVYKFALHYINERRLRNVLGGTLADPYDEAFCFECHDGAGYYGEAGMDADDNIKNIYTTYAASPDKHDVESAGWSGRHKPDEATTDFGSANRHVECQDCHNPHTAQTQTAEYDGKPLIGARGLDVSAWPVAGDPTTNTNTFVAIPAGNYSLTTVTSTSPKQQEYKICLKCHSNYAGALPNTTDFFGRTLTGGRNIAEEINPNNPSYHGIVPVAGTAAPGPGVGHNLAINGNAGTMLTTYNNINTRFPVAGTVATVFCSDCHTLDPATNAEGPHASNIDKMLVATITSDQAGGTPLCLQCHAAGYWNGTVGASAYSQHGNGNHGSGAGWNRGCFTCHMWNFAICGNVYGAGPPASGFNNNYNGATPGVPGAGYGQGGIFVHGMRKKWYYKDYGQDTAKQGTKAGVNCTGPGAVNAGNLLVMSDGFLDGFQATEDYVARQCWTEVCRIHNGTGW